MPACRICGSEHGHREYLAREMMFGTRETFKYFRCARCECLQIAAIPEDIARHYPEGYYSFNGKPPSLVSLSRMNIILNALRIRLTFGFLGALAPFISTSGFVRLWARRARIGLSDRVLDVGCGQGRYLHELARMGFSSLTGIDLFVAQDTTFVDGVKIFKKNLNELKGPFDFIMLHHSFEHMPDPLATLKEVHRLLIPGKLALIRIPLISSLAWKKYSTHWVSLDAPRHFHLHSLTSMKLLAQNAGFVIEDVIFDSTDFQFWGSEQYLSDIPLFAPNSYALNRKISMFSWVKIKIFEARAVKANLDRLGDQACFFLRRIPET